MLFRTIALFACFAALCGTARADEGAFIRAFYSDARPEPVGYLPGPPAVVQTTVTQPVLAPTVVAPVMAAVPGVPVAPAVAAVPGVPVAPAVAAVPGVPVAPAVAAPGVAVTPGVPAAPGVPAPPAAPAAPGAASTSSGPDLVQGTDVAKAVPGAVAAPLPPAPPAKGGLQPIPAPGTKPADGLMGATPEKAPATGAPVAPVTPAAPGAVTSPVVAAPLAPVAPVAPAVAAPIVKPAISSMLGAPVAASRMPSSVGPRALRYGAPPVSPILPTSTMLSSPAHPLAAAAIAAPVVGAPVVTRTVTRLTNPYANMDGLLYRHPAFPGKMLYFNRAVRRWVVQSGLSSTGWSYVPPEWSPGYEPL